MEQVSCIEVGGIVGEDQIRSPKGRFYLLLSNLTGKKDNFNIHKFSQTMNLRVAELPLDKD